MGVDYSGVLIYGRVARELDVKFDKIMRKAEKKDYERYKSFDLVCTNHYSGHDEYNTLIGLDCSSKSLDEINSVREEFTKRFKAEFGMEPKLMCEGQVW